MKLLYYEKHMLSTKLPTSSAYNVVRQELFTFKEDWFYFGNLILIFFSKMLRFLKEKSVL